VSRLHLPVVGSAPRREAWRWWFLAAVWMHIAAIGALKLVPLPAPPQSAPIPLIALSLVPEERPSQPETLLPPLSDEPPPTEFVSFVRSDPDAPEEAPRDPIAISDRSTRALESTRTPRDPDRPGPTAAGDPTEGVRDGGDRSAPAGSAITAPGPRFVDPVEHLREALGWGPIDRADLGPRAAWGDPRRSSGQSGPSAPIAADLPLSWDPAADVEGTPLGRYVARLEDVVLATWRETDLTIGDRARGVAGRVGVRYRVSPDGRTSAVHVSASSGYALLDTLALRAIPERVPPFPADLDRDSPLWHEVSLRYDNPFVATGL